MLTSKEGYQRLIDGAPHPRKQGSILSRDERNTKLRRLGTAEFALAATAVLLGIVAVSSFHYKIKTNRASLLLAYNSSGVWAGVTLAVCGIMGVIFKSNPSERMYIANMSMSIISAMTCLSGTVMSGLGAAFYVTEKPMHYPMFALHLAVALCLTAGRVICICHSVYCCCFRCGERNVSERALQHTCRETQELR